MNPKFITRSTVWRVLAILFGGLLLGLIASFVVLPSLQSSSLRVGMPFERQVDDPEEKIPSAFLSTHVVQEEDATPVLIPDEGLLELRDEVVSEQEQYIDEDSSAVSVSTASLPPSHPACPSLKAKDRVFQAQGVEGRGVVSDVIWCHYHRKFEEVIEGWSTSTFQNAQVQYEHQDGYVFSVTAQDCLDKLGFGETYLTGACTHIVRAIEAWPLPPGNTFSVYGSDLAQLLPDVLPR